MYFQAVAALQHERNRGINQLYNGTFLKDLSPLSIVIKVLDL